ncbi:hypothetical protein [Dysgonomonas sp. 520]|uniref:hypothetical protein n=1 Tax=Dysgonomonas sp. 520 TaxID=2302931 RepID=UPI0013D30A99|nr:hypothetical protein [Dysgonomonas sp. 520]NDW10577.1 hypothetical protein [Dysgonomonas sp. 520]
MNVKEFYELIDTQQAPEESNLPKLRFLVNKYPYFQAGLFAYLKCLYAHDSETFRAELFRLSIFISDRKALFYYILNDEFSRFLKNKGKQELSKDRTSILMDAFFETLEDDNDEKLEQVLTHTTMSTFDYFSYLQSLEDAEENTTHVLPKENLPMDDKPETNEAAETPKTTSELKRQDLIDSFINKAEENGEDIKITFDIDSLPPQQDGGSDDMDLDDELDDDGIFFTETLANIYIKQRKYEKAYEIIKRLSLNYPKKNIYFADQLAFLEKLMSNIKNNKQ